MEDLCLYGLTSQCQPTVVRDHVFLCHVMDDEVVSAHVGELPLHPGFQGAVERDPFSKGWTPGTEESPFYQLLRLVSRAVQQQVVTIHAGCVSRGRQEIHCPD